MWKLFQVMAIFVVMFGVYYAIDKYETNRWMASMKEMQVVQPNTLDKVSITKFPEQTSYLSFDYTEVQDVYRAMKGLEVQDTKRVQPSASYVKIRLAEDGGKIFIEYYLYESGDIVYKEDAIAVYKEQHYKADAQEVKALVAQLLTNKVLD